MQPNAAPPPDAPGDPPRHRYYYSAWEDALLLRLGASGIPWAEVHRRMRRSSPSALRDRFRRLYDEEARTARRGKAFIPKPGSQRRPCLCCGTPFWSEGHHNRMCDPCRAAS